MGSILLPASTLPVKCPVCNWMKPNSNLADEGDHSYGASFVRTPEQKRRIPMLIPLFAANQGFSLRLFRVERGGLLDRWAKIIRNQVFGSIILTVRESICSTPWRTDHIQSHVDHELSLPIAQRWSHKRAYKR